MNPQGEVKDCRAERGKTHPKNDRFYLRVTRAGEAAYDHHCKCTQQEARRIDDQPEKGDRG